MDSDGDQRKVVLNRWLLYFIIFLIIALPVIVGVAVYFATPECRGDAGEAGVTAPSTGDDATTTKATPTDAPGENNPWLNLRLPKYIVPIHYDITLYPDFYGDHGWFYGNETILLNIMQATNFVLIHFNFLNMTKTELRNMQGEIIPINRTFAYEENQFWVIETERTIAANQNVSLMLQFDGSLTRAIVGFYKSVYTNSITGEERYLATSKFQPVDARRAFPCFDEPNIKAEYTINMVHDPEYIALSNMPEEEFSPWEWNPALRKTKFARSVKMSTYLVCFIVCDFANITTKTKYDTQIRVFATPDRIAQAQYSLEVMKTTMELYQELFDMGFPLPKNDMIAIPDFVSGAMEHWGLITYREVNMLYNESEASSANKQRVAVVVAHEIAHMWFGNIVTMDWWDDLWLNEGFASFMEYLGVEAVESTWEMMDQIVIGDAQPVMITDSGVNSHPIVVEVNHPDQINEVFDAISYSKGASVIYMLQVIMGSEDFFKGISSYLKKYEWGTAVTDDLWTELKQVPAGYTVKDVMDTWTRQMGLPYINVTLKQEGTTTSIVAEQRRFLADRTMQYNVSESPYMYKWYVHLDYTLSDGRSDSQWIEKTQDEVTFPLSVNLNDASKWVKFNINQTGFYRVNYPNLLWERFATLLVSNENTLLPVDRSGLLDDAVNLARGGYLEYDVALQMTSYLDRERHYFPWKSAFEGFEYISDMFGRTGDYNHLRKYVLAKAKPVLDDIKWNDGGSHLYKRMRSNIITLVCGFDESDCMGNATQRFRDWIDNKAIIAPNLRTYVYKYGMKSSGRVEDWDFMWERYRTETVPQEQTKLLYGMAHTREVWLLQRFFDYAKDESKVRSQDFFTVVSYIASNPVGRELAWDWAQANWEYLVDRFSLYSRSLGRMVPNIIRTFNTEFKLQEVQKFFQKYPDAGSGARGRQQALENIERNIAWMNNNRATISQWLEMKTTQL